MGHTYNRHEAILALVLAVVATSEGRSQTINREPNATEVAASLRTKGHVGGARAVLSQARGPKSQQQLDEIADTLVAIAAGFPGDDLRGGSTRLAALTTLVLAGQGDNGIVGLDRAVPYAGAAARLMLLAETAQDVGIRGGALSGLLALPSRSANLPFLRQVATSQNRVAWFAVYLLGNDTGPEGRAIARELYRQGRVAEPTARKTLNGVAKGFGWR